jgi:hypothetical protein
MKDWEVRSKARCSPSKIRTDDTVRSCYRPQSALVVLKNEKKREEVPLNHYRKERTWRLDTWKKDVATETFHQPQQSNLLLAEQLN